MRWSEFAAHEELLAAVAHDQLVKLVLRRPARRGATAGADKRC